MVSKAVIIGAIKDTAEEVLNSLLYGTQMATFTFHDPYRSWTKEILTGPSAFKETLLRNPSTFDADDYIQPIALILKEKINDSIKKNDIEVVVRGLKFAQQTKYIPFETLLLLINQGSTESLQECNGTIKSDPRICNFIKTGSLEFVPPPPPPVEPRASFEGYVSNHQKCLKNEDAFAVCKEMFCEHVDEKQCEGRTLPPFEAFDKGEL